jgi:hypothetical protein
MFMQVFIERERRLNDEAGYVKFFFAKSVQVNRSAARVQQSRFGTAAQQKPKGLRFNFPCVHG